MIEKIKKAINWLNWMGGLRDESCMFETGDPIENAAIMGMVEL